MIKNYIILVHKNSEQVYRLIQKLQDGKSYFFIHLDAKCNINDFKILNSCPNTIFIKERENCIWGDFSIVKATLNLIKNVIDSGNTGFTILLSGQDYPIKSSAEITLFFERNSSFNFIEAVEIEKRWNKKMVKNKVDHYHIIHSDKRSDSNSYAPFFHSTAREKARTLLHFGKRRLSVNNLKKIIKLPKRVSVFDQQFAGSQWWALNYESLICINDYVTENYAALLDYYQYTSSPDEIFFQTILKNLQKNNPHIHIEPSITYVDWSKRNCPLPVTFSKKDLKELLSVPHLFARKFDIDEDEEILNLIDKKLLAT